MTNQALWMEAYMAGFEDGIKLVSEKLPKPCEYYHEGRCSGTRECDAVNCNGDEQKCDLEK